MYENVINHSIDIFIFYIDKYGCIVSIKKTSHALSKDGIIPTDQLKRIISTFSMFDRCKFHVDDILSYNNTFDVNVKHHNKDTLCNHTINDIIQFNPTSRILRKLNCIILIMRFGEKKNKTRRLKQ
jgi:hypothetical protein